MILMRGWQQSKHYDILTSKNSGIEHFGSVKILIIQKHEKFTVVTIKFEKGGLTIELCIQKMQTEWQMV